MEAYNNDAISLSNATITTGTEAKEQTVTVSASNGDIKGDLRVVVTENLFTYKPVDEGFEIDNGKENYTRPIYPPHMKDDLLGVNGEKSTRFIYYLGDQPKLVLTSVSGTNVFKRYAHMFIGIKDAFGGWRSHYGFVDAGWGDRIKTNAKQFMKTQSDNGRIWVYPNVGNRYNMNIVLVDGLLQYWEWSGDDIFFVPVENATDLTPGNNNLVK